MARFVLPGRYNCLLVLFLVSLLPISTASATTRLVSVGLNGPANNQSFAASISGNGQRIGFGSFATNLTPDGQGKNSGDVYVRDVSTGMTFFVGQPPPGVTSIGLNAHAVVSGDGRWVAFDAPLSNFTAGADPSRNVYVKDLTTGEVRPVSQTPGGEPGDGESSLPAISADGSRIAFLTTAGNLGGGFAGYPKVLVADLNTNFLIETAIAPDGNGCGCSTDRPAISADGKRVAFSTTLRLVPEDLGDSFDVYVMDVDTGAIRLASRGKDAKGTPVSGNGNSALPSLGADGNRVAFESLANNLVPGDTSGNDVFVTDLTTNEVRRANVSAVGAQADQPAARPSISGNGRWVAFETGAGNLAPGDAGGQNGIFVKDLDTNAVRRVTLTPAGAPANGTSRNAAVSLDGKWIAFESDSNTLVAGATGLLSVYVADNTLNAVSVVQMPGPPLLTELGVSPEGPYAPGAAVTVSATVSSRLALNGVTAQLGSAAPVPMTLTAGRWVASFNLPSPTALTQIMVAVKATDAQSRTADGTLTLAIKPPVSPPSGDWVFLVRGFARFNKKGTAKAGSWSDFHDFIEDPANKAHLGGIAPERFVSVTGINLKDTYKVNALRLAKFINTFLTNHKVAPNDRVYLIGHSTGGAVSRIYLKRYRNDPAYGPDIARVQRLVLVGTPNRGTRAATYFKKNYLKARNKKRIRNKKQLINLLRDLSVSGGVRLSEEYPHATDDPKFSYVAGRYSKGCDSFYRAIHAYLNGSAENVNDGLVPQSSAFASSITGYDKTYPILSAACNEALIQKPTAIRTVLAGLFGKDPAAAPAEPAPQQSDPDDPDETLLSQNDYEIPAGEALSIPLPVGNEKGVSVSVSFLDSGAEATLFGPSGEGAPVEQDADFASWDLGDAAPGEWTLNLQSMGVDGEPTIAVVSIVTADAVTFEGDVTPPLVVDEPVTLEAFLEPGSYQTSGLTVSATVTPGIEDAATNDVPLHDDGVAPDAAAGDDVFSGTYQPTAYAEYAVDFHAVGKYADGRDLDRTMAAVFESYRSPGDLNGDGGIDVVDAVLSLQFAAEVAVPTDAQKAAGDINLDGALNVEDSVLILKHIVFDDPLDPEPEIDDEAPL